MSDLDKQAFGGSWADIALKVTQKNREIKEMKREKVGDLAAGLAVAGGAAALTAKSLTKKKTGLEVAKQKKVLRSAMLDDPDVPLSPELEKQYEGARKSRQAISEYKKKRLKFRNYGYLNKKYADFEKARTMPQGIDMIGEKAGGKFVKEAKPDSIYSKGMTTKERKALQMQRGGYFKMPAKDIRKRIMNRALLQSQLGDAGVDTYFYRKRKGAPITMAQEILKPIDKAQYKMVDGKITKLDHKMAAQEMMMEMRQKGVIPQDMHAGNIGIDAKGRAKPIDLGHSMSGDYEYMLRKPEIRKAIESRNVMSKTNRRLYMKKAKQWAKRLPMIAPLIGAGMFATAPNKAKATEDIVTDTLTAGTGVDTLASGMPPHIEKKLRQEARSRRAKERLQMLERRLDERQSSTLKSLLKPY